MTVVVGVDGAGRTHRLREIAAAAGVPVVRVDGRAGDEVDLTGVPAGPPDEGCLVVVDDAHRLPDPALRTLAAAARRGVRMAIARRPTVDRPALAALDEAVAEQGPVESLGPLDDDALAALISTVTGRPAGPEAVARVREASAGQAAIAAAVATVVAGPDAGESGGVPSLAARLQHRLTRLPASTVDLAQLLALGLDLTDDVLAGAAGLAPGDLAAAMRTLRDEGMLVPGGERLIPAVAQTLLADAPPAQRRRLHDRVARALIAAGGDPVAAANQLSAARVRTGQAAQVYAAAADRLRFTDPEAASTWYDDALDAGADPATLAAGRAEAEALLGRPVDVDATPAAPEEARRVALAAGAAAAHQGRATRAAEALTAAGDPGPLLAVPVLVAVGRPEPAQRAAAGTGPLPVRRFAEAALAAGDPAAAVPLLLEAAEALIATPPALVLPDTPHAVGALVAVTAGDGSTAEHLLQQAIAGEVGGPVGVERHRALLAWVRLRTGRFDTAVAELRRLAGTALPGRELLLAAVLAAGIARRSGDIAALKDAWAAAEPVLARQAVDLFHLEPMEELLVAAARLRQYQRLTPVLERLDAIVTGLGAPPAWVVSLAWVRLQIAVVGEDAAAAAAAAGAIERALDGGGTAAHRQAAQGMAAAEWARALAGEVDPDAVVAATEALAAAELPWEASRLAGQAAIRTADQAAARRLLERARELTAADLEAANRPETSHGGLSEREREVARLVLDGRTYREIGAQLYLSPKTVEHHVARVRTKLGATSRAELVAALRRIFGDQSSPDRQLG
ncbi:MAG TPA: helix-turn-helix transcriptional regulator [Natronosporangium sp.]|nr:helix-turn-helix transcriptional regulator [Natronosporangium sp.]